MAISLILAFYSPCDYTLPQRHLAQTLDWVSRQIRDGVSATLAQVVRPGQQPQPVPANVESHVYETRSVLFYKENLWNITAEKAPHDKLLFLDADVYFSHPNVIDMTEQHLDECDIMQPFELSVWTDKAGNKFQTRKCSAFAIASNMEPAPAYYHPGFSWAMNRSTFNRLSGFYERHPFGGGDVALSYAIDTQWVGSKVPYYLPVDAQYWTSPSYRAYQKNGVSLGLKVSYLPGVEATHRWHGEVKDRQYVNRGKHFEIESGSEYPMHRRHDGLLEWESQEISDKVRNYFITRKEDG